MRVSVFGAGYVGLVTAACFAEVGHDVTCCDKDATKIDLLRSGKVPFFEPGLLELVAGCVASGRLKFTTDVAEAVLDTQVAILAVGTPSLEGGSADISQVRAAAEEISSHAQSSLAVIIKSTVPVGTNASLASLLAEKSIGVISNPEFLREGSAVVDGLNPDRVVAGVRTDSDADLIRELYEPFTLDDKKLMFMTPESAELVKYGANSMLATRISFMNELAEYASRVGANIDDVRLGIGTDPRVGPSYLNSGVGFGGSCLPKDLRSLKSQMEQQQVDSKVISAAISRNERQADLAVGAILQAVKLEPSPVVALWGVSFKPNTDDIREAPSLKIAKKLVAAGVKVRLTDPAVLEQQVYFELGTAHTTFTESEMDAVDGADALVLLTEWQQYRSPDFYQIRALMRGKAVVDGRGLWSEKDARAAGLTYVRIG